jgi:hypothetical protein
MRIGILALVVVIATGMAAGAAPVAANHTPVPIQPSHHVAAQTSVTPAADQTFSGGVKRFNQSYHNHRKQFVAVSDYSERTRHNWLVGLFAFAVFVLLTLPKNLGGVRAFYRQMMEHSPLSAEAGVTDDDNRQARKVLFFYLLFLLYQLIEFPLTLGHDRGIPFYTDLIVQTGLLIAVVWTFHRLKRGLHNRWRGDSARQEKMDHWLGEKLDGMNVRWRDIRKLAVGVFIAGFTPAALSHLTGWLDVLTDFGERMTG